MATITAAASTAPRTAWATPSPQIGSKATAAAPQLSQSLPEGAVAIRGHTSKAFERASSRSTRSAISRLSASSCSGGAPTASSQLAPSGFGATNSHPPFSASIQHAD